MCRSLGPLQAEEMSRRRTILLIHGVGRIEPRVVGDAIAKLLAWRSSTVREVLVGEDRLLEYERHDGEKSLLEMNWSDILRPRRHVLDIFRFVAYLVTSLLDLAVEGRGGAAGDAAHAAWPARAYRLAVTVLSPGAVLLVTFIMVGASVEDDRQRLLFGLVALVAAGSLAIALQRLGTYFRWLWPWIGACGCVLLLSVPQQIDPRGDGAWILAASRALRGLGFLLVVSLLAIAALASLCTTRGQRWERRVAELALLCLPFIAINIAMTWFSFLGMELMSGFGGFAAWEVAMRPPMDWYAAEMATTIIIAAVGVLGILLPLAGYGLGGLRKRVGLWHQGVGGSAAEVNRRGRGAQTGAAIVLAILPVALAGLGVYTILLALQGEPLDRSLLDIYEFSILRVLPYLAWLVGPFSIVLDVIGDVLFYIRPQGAHPASSRAACDRRLTAALEHALASSSEVLVVAHSQGSVIAANVLGRRGDRRIRLLTLGSPLGALYERFLSLPLGALEVPWVNVYRDGDYIGGPISAASSNLNIGGGGHTGYWSDERLSALLRSTSA